MCGWCSSFDCVSKIENRFGIGRNSVSFSFKNCLVAILCVVKWNPKHQNNKRCWCVHSIHNTNANRLKDDTITKFTHKYTCCSVLVFGSVDITCRVFYYGNLTKFIFTISLVINKYARDRCYFCFVLLLSSFNQIKHDLQPMLLNNLYTYIEIANNYNFKS